MCLNHDVGDRANRCDRRRMRMMRGRRIDSAARDVRLRLRWVARNSLTGAGLHARVGSYVATDGITRNCIDRHIVVCVVFDIIILRLIHHAVSPLPLLWRFPIFRCHASSRIVICSHLSSFLIACSPCASSITRLLLTRVCAQPRKSPRLGNASVFRLPQNVLCR